MPTNLVVMILGIVAISTFGRIYAAKHGLNLFGGRMNRREMRYRAKHGLLDPAATQADPEADRMREEIKTLKERIQVLERVITDTNSAASLDREIEKLR